MGELLAVDLFAGAGGATQGLKDAGFSVVGAVEIEEDAAGSYRANHPHVRLEQCDIRAIAATRFRQSLGLAVGELALLKACPPCQGFSSLAEGRVQEDVERNDLVLSVIRFVRAFQPAAVLIENVPGMRRDRRFSAFMEQLTDLGYAARAYIVQAADFGVPQRRRRLIIIGLRGRRRIEDLPADLVTPSQQTPRTVRDVLDSLASVDLERDQLNVHRHLQPTTLRRVRAIPVGGDRKSLPIEYQLACHVKVDATKGTGAGSSYGRMRLDDAAPTMTTRCTTVACGRFIHPTEHRGITLREAASIQTFPVSYEFIGGYGSVERQIGNAVPVLLAHRVGAIVRTLLSADTRG